ncbi:hypothetical protein [Stomatohabitans albus]|uniref:hypothetical protein n=1 Tax=Stomatohabitans albus TaxID=3110766 RepID=UPI00300D9214
MRLSRSTLICLASCLAVGLSACGGNTTADAPSDATPSDTSTQASDTEAASGESASPSASSTPTAAAKPKERDFKTWYLPAQDYETIDILLVQKAEQVALSRCVAEKGIDAAIPPVTYDEAVSKEMMDNAQALAQFTPEHAAAKGYRLSLINDNNREFQQYFTTLAQSGDFEKTAKVLECYSTIHETYPVLNIIGNDVGEPSASEPAPGGGINQDFLAEAQRNMKAVKTPEVAEASAKWRECMAPLGIEDLPETPAQMPPVSKMREWYDLANGDSPLSGEAGESEKQAATHDAQCRLSSGYSEAAYNAYYDASLKDVTENKQKYEDKKARQEARHQELLDFIKKFE